MTCKYFEWMIFYDVIIHILFAYMTTIFHGWLILLQPTFELDIPREMNADKKLELFEVFQS